MAALAEAFEPEVVDLRRVRASELEPLLEEELATWRARFRWDFESSAELVRRFVESRALNGCALRIAGQVVGYAYYVCEEHKGLIGDLYVLEKFATAELEAMLLDAVVEGLRATPMVGRIEAQLLMMRYTPQRWPVGTPFDRHPRLFLQVDLKEATRLRPGKAPKSFVFERWREHWLDEAARLIADSYSGHMDAEINDQYRTVEGARRFLGNITQYPGCGTFSESASWIAFDPETRELRGMVLTSKVAPEIGHITQICTAPVVRGEGIGYELLRKALDVFRREGMEQVSLTVTEGNQAAVKLYESTGFEVRRRFDAYVWEEQFD